MNRSFAWLVISMLSACDPPGLIVVDGGVDAGFADAGFVDAGETDAGFVDDAGVPDVDVDAGFPTPTDAGPPLPVCIFDDRSVFDFQCEGDEDFCDPDPDPRVPTPETDIVATWSRVEGDFAVIDVRTRATLYKLERTEIDLCIAWSFAGLDTTGLGSFGPYEPDPWACGAIVLLGSTPPYGFPLGINIGLSPVNLPFDLCSIEVSLHSPVFRYFIPFTNESDFRYQSYAHRRIAGNRQPDFAIEGFQIDFLSSSGGTPDDVGPFVSVCDLTCNTAGGREE